MDNNDKNNLLPDIDRKEVLMVLFYAIAMFVVVCAEILVSLHVPPQ